MIKNKFLFFSKSHCIIFSGTKFDKFQPLHMYKMHYLICRRATADSGMNKFEINHTK